MATGGEYLSPPKGCYYCVKACDDVCDAMGAKKVVASHKGTIFLWVD